MPRETMQTLVMAEGRRLKRLSRDLSPPVFGAVINEYQCLLRNVIEQTGGRQFEVSEDTAIAPTAIPHVGPRRRADSIQTHTSP